MNNPKNNNETPQGKKGAGNLFAVNSGLVTGAEGNIGRGTGYHVDMKFKDLIANGDWKKVTEIIDTMSMQYKERGARMEFCNSGVSGKVWNNEASLKDKIELAQKAVAAHNHNPATTGFSMDFFIAKNGQSRFDDGIKDQEFALAVPVGGSVKYLSSKGYGNNAQILDKDGKELYVIGHGDKTKPLPKNFTFTGEGAAVANASTDPAKKPSSVPTSEQKIPEPEEVKKEVEKKGAKNTYQDMMQSFGQQGGGGFIGVMLFLLVIAAAGKNIESENVKPAISDSDKRNGVLQQIDIERNQKIQPSALQSQLQKIPVYDVPFNSPPSSTPKVAVAGNKMTPSNSL